MKRLFPVILLIVLLAALLAVPAAAETADTTKEYAINSAHFDVALNTDGSADITETWVVRYLSGDFTRFYHDISYFGVGSYESFTISNVRVWIDGTECAPTEDTENRPDWCYHIDSDSPGAEISAYLRSSGVARTYVFQYRLNDVIKWLDDGRDLFNYRFVGYNFTQTINDLSITLTVPNGTPRIQTVSRGTAVVDGTTVTCSASNSSGIYQLIVFIDDADIPGAAVSSKTDHSAVETSMLIIGIIIVCMALGFLIAPLLPSGPSNYSGSSGGGGGGGGGGCGGGGCGGGGAD